MSGGGGRSFGVSGRRVINASACLRCSGVSEAAEATHPYVKAVMQSVAIHQKLLQPGIFPSL